MPRTPSRLSALTISLLVVLTLAMPAASADPAPAPPPAPAGAPDPNAPPVPPPAPVYPTAEELSGQFDAIATSSRIRAERADAELAAAGAQVADLATRVTTVETQQRIASSARAVAAARLETTRREVREIAIAQYKARSVPPSPTFLTARTPVEADRRDKLDAAASDRFEEIMQSYLAQRDAADRQTRAAAAQLSRLYDEQARATQRLSAAKVEQADAAAQNFKTQLATSTAMNPWITILGPNVLRADELLAWYKARGFRANTTVPIEQLIPMYIEEGNLAGVRGDVAFVQSVIETGSFTFPGGGLVAGRDNNFAGIGACDSCAHGFQFPDARTGVRAQMQALRIYADPWSTNANLGSWPVMPSNIGVYTHGKVPFWMGLAGTWATAQHYGITIRRIYAEITLWVLEHPQPLPAAPAPPAPSGTTATG